MRGKLIIEGNSVYEIDEECLKRKRSGGECGKEKKDLKNSESKGIVKGK